MVSEAEVKRLLRKQKEQGLTDNEKEHLFELVYSQPGMTGSGEIIEGVLMAFFPLRAPAWLAAKLGKPVTSTAARAFAFMVKGKRLSRPAAEKLAEIARVISREAYLTKVAYVTPKFEKDAALHYALSIINKNPSGWSALAQSQTVGQLRGGLKAAYNGMRQAYLQAFGKPAGSAVDEKIMSALAKMGGLTKEGVRGALGPVNRERAVGQVLKDAATRGVDVSRIGATESQRSTLIRALLDDGATRAEAIRSLQVIDQAMRLGIRPIAGGAGRSVQVAERFTLEFLPKQQVRLMYGTQRVVTMPMLPVVPKPFLPSAPEPKEPEPKDRPTVPEPVIQRPKPKIDGEVEEKVKVEEEEKVVEKDKVEEKVEEKVKVEEEEKVVEKDKVEEKVVTETETETQPKTGGPKTGGPRRLKEVSPTAKPPIGPLPFLLPSGGTLSKGKYPHTIQWTQGNSIIQRNLITGGTRYYRNPGNPRLKPWHTLRVIKTSGKPPRPQRLDLGMVDVIISRRSLRYVPSRNGASIPERGLRERSPFRRSR